MIKKFFWLAALTFLLLSLLFSREFFFMNQGYSNNFAIAVVQVSSAKLKSYITYFDENLNEISTQQINHGGLSHFWDFPKFSCGKIFMNVKGTDLWLKKQVMSLNLDSGKYNLYNTGQKFNNCLTVDSKAENFYTTNCDGNSNIVKYNISSNLIRKLCIPNFYITHMNVLDDNKTLLAFGNSIADESPLSFIYVIDSELMVIKKAINITNYGFGQYDSKKVGDNIFFASNINNLTKNDSQKDDSALCKYNIKTNKITKTKLNINHPKQILLWKDKLIISHEDWHQNGNHISIYDLNTHKVSNIKLSNVPYQICIFKDKLYVLDSKSLFRYSICDLKLEKKVDFDVQKRFGHDFFVSAIFSNKE